MATAAERMRALRERACRGIRRLTIDEGSCSGSDLSIGRCCSAAMRPVDCLFWLGPISKSSEEDEEAGELHEAKEVLRIKLPADKNATLPLYPGEEAFNQPAPGISPKPSSILRGALAAIGSVWRDHLDAVFA